MSAPVQDSLEKPKRWLREALGLPEGTTPFPWQEELLKRFANAEIERSLDIPTGLGKTAVMAIWLVARACGAPLPRRLVYVVDRRAVVDQATDVAMSLRAYVDQNPDFKARLGLTDRSLPISTLRGQHVDNREWLEDPASPAIIVGTVDMIGSRLLFEGYGTSRKMRPYHAGLLGADTLVVLDEAHLVPPFEKLLETVGEGGAAFGPRDVALRELVPRFTLVSLSATGRASARNSFGLQKADLDHRVVKRRVWAPKRLTVLPLLDDGTKLEDALAEQAWKLAQNGNRAVRCIVFCDRREVAKDTKEAVDKLAKGDTKAGRPEVKIDRELFVGGRRVFERAAVANWLKEHGFIAGTKVEPARPTFVFATSAGEVGVDLDADHMVSDLVAWERMVQRLGRVNRRGDGDANVIVVAEPEPKPKKGVQDALAKKPADRNEKEAKAVAAYQASLAWARALRKPLDHLPHKHGAADASPGALRELKFRAQTELELQAILEAATTPAPLRPALSRALVDAWSMTSLEDHPGRPDVEPWLRGWIENDPPQTELTWRAHMPVRKRNGFTIPMSKKEIQSFYESAPPHGSEVLETETFRVVKWLAARARAILERRGGTTRSTTTNSEPSPLEPDDIVAVALTKAGDLHKILRLRDLVGDGEADEGEGRGSKKIEEIIAGATVVVDARLGGLKEGLLDSKAANVPRTADDGAPWMQERSGASPTQAPVVRFRVRRIDAGRQPALDRDWRERLRLPLEISLEGEPARWLVVEKWRHDAANEEDRSAANPQLLREHQEWAEVRARTLGVRLGLPREYQDLLAIAARLHDEGKRPLRWQRAFNAPDGNLPYAKTNGPINLALLDGYRHELGSVFRCAKDPRLASLPEDLRELALHLIAAHHGFARPFIETRSCDDTPPSALEERAKEIALRFAKLQQRWGPWGLAWWEALLRAADQQASRDNDSRDRRSTRDRS